MADAELRIICGPTAAGKSAIAISLAERFGGTIISADSRQIYRGFDIGTAKPSADERRRVPHEGIDVCEPTERYSAAQWASAAREWIGRAHDDGRVPAVVGGTGFYIRALVEPLFREPPMQPERRLELQRELANISTERLRAWCATLDPERAHLGRTQLLRAIEVALLTGRTISSWYRDSPPAPAVPARYLLVAPERTVLRARIRNRVQAFLAGGWLEEVRELALVVPTSAPAWQGTGYEEARRIAAGDISLEEGRERIVTNTQQYAKRQRTWLRHQLPPGLVTPLDPGSRDATRVAEEWWHAA